MAFPPGFLAELRERASLARYAEAHVRWDERRSKRQSGEYWACCPFHDEKTASFKIDDRRGFYYCFGCHAKGDIFGFVREMERVSFRDAVARIAGQAGMSVPAETEEDRRRAEEAERLHRANEVALAFYREKLAAPAGAAARRYVFRERGLEEETVRRFAIGFAPDARDALDRHLREAGVRPEDAVAAGLSRVSEGARRDFFRNRVMFPLIAPGGRCVGFGGRALRDDVRAKYLNSAESPVFRKKRMLYHLGPAREAARRTGRIIVAEGYMDVIALVAAGFGDAVAPLGTALSEEQLDLLWGAVNEVVLALDGDEAGLRAADRVVDLALPKVGADRRLQFAILPRGQDPDDLLREGGADGMRAILDGALPLVDMIWRRVGVAGPGATPEEALDRDQRLERLVARIRDEDLRRHYRQALRDRTRNAGASGGGASLAARGTKISGKSGTADGYGRRAREAAILLTAVRHPAALEEFGGELAELEFESQRLDSLLRDLISALADGEVDAAPIERQLKPVARRTPHAMLVPCTQADAEPTVVREGMRVLIETHCADVATRREAAAATREIASDEAGPEAVWRLRRVAAERAAMWSAPPAVDGENAERSARDQLRSYRTHSN